MSDTYMPGRTRIGKSAGAIRVADAADGVSRVVVMVDSQNSYVAGDDTGSTVTVTCPYGTQAIADALLAELSGYQYQPLEADGAVIDPAVEIGDWVMVDGGTEAVIARSDLTFDALMTADISAPGGTELESEYHAPTQAERFDLKLATVYSRISKTAEEIRAEVVDEINGLQSSLTLTAREIRSEVSDAVRGVESSISQTADAIRAEITGENGALTQLSATVDGISTVVSGPDGQSGLVQKVGEISTTINGVDGRSGIKQTVDKISAEVIDASGNFSIQQSSISGFESRVGGIENAVANAVNESTARSIANTAITQTMNSITLSAQEGSNQSTLTISAGGIRVDSAVVRFADIVADNVKANATISAPTIIGGKLVSGVPAGNGSGVVAGSASLVVEGARPYGASGSTLEQGAMASLYWGSNRVASVYELQSVTTLDLGNGTTLESTMVNGRNQVTIYGDWKLGAGATFSGLTASGGTSTAVFG